VKKMISDHLDLWTNAIKRKPGSARGSSSKVEFYGVKKLRALIQELAIRGLLVPQDPRDEPASELLRKISVEKASLIKEGKLKKEKPLPQISDVEKPFRLPAGWSWCRLTDIAFPQAGFAFKSNAFNEADEGLPLIRIRDVGQPFSGTYYNGSYREEFLVRNGDYLISMDGNFRVAPWKGPDALLNQRVSRLLFHGKNSAQRFVAEALQLRLLALQGIKAYTTVDHLSGGQIAESVIAFPPLAEQHRIVDRVDELMRLCDQLEQQSETSLGTHQTLVDALLGALANATDHLQFASAWRCISEHFDSLFSNEDSIDRLMHAVLQLAVMGKLVPQDSSDEPAFKVYAKALELPVGYTRSNKQKIKNDGAIVKARLPPLPTSWTHRTVDQLYLSKHLLDYEDGNHGSLYPRATDFAEEGVIFLTAAQIADDGRIAWDDCQRLSSEYAEKLSKGWSQRGDVYFTHNATVGKTAIATDPPEKDFLLGTSVTLYRINGSCIDSRYLYFFFSSPAWYQQAAAVMQQTTRNQVSITKQALFTIVLPPPAEQRRIAAKVDELFAICRELRLRLSDSRTILLHAADAITEKALEA